MKLHGCLLALLFTIGAAAASQGSDVQRHADFQAAIQDGSTSPYYVKIRIIDELSGAAFDTCVPANLFMGAVHLEWELPYSEEGTIAAEKLAYSRADHVFSFSRPAALENMPWHPSPAELSTAAQLVASNSALLREALENGALHAYYFGHTRSRHRMAALACSLIVRGYRPRVADLSGQLYVER